VGRRSSDLMADDALRLLMLLAVLLAMVAHTFGFA
jgi:hypothetical protein